MDLDAAHLAVDPGGEPFPPGRCGAPERAEVPMERDHDDVG